MNNNTKTFAFILGRDKDLAFTELISVLERFCFIPSNPKDDIIRITGNIAFAKLNFGDKKWANFLEACNSLAGTIKVFEVTENTSGSIIQNILNIINALKFNTKFNYGISDYSSASSAQDLNKLGLKIKGNLKKTGHKSRFVMAKDGTTLSSIVSLKNGLVEKGVEIGIFDQYVGKLVFLNNPEEWNKRDYGKPKGDKFSGMLPPKLSRLLVNIALSSEKPSGSLVYDPFCGSGNIIIEAMMLGCEVAGSDVSEKAVNYTCSNIDWLVKEYKLLTKFEIFKADSTNSDLSCLGLNGKPITIVTEPYLGRPKKYAPTFHEAESEYSEIKKIYLSFLQNIKQINHNELKDICLIFPLVQTSENKQYSLFSSCVDEIKKMGYTQTRNLITYGREYQVVKREIVLLNLTSAE